eukprot:CAMPEP_0181328146 /NCGR_PEP_ID=MMETSP1101-20121128/22530_1 /TAXON_ID=46948 /ORGANISM="Rhodomonas abbreviata, Strain Caron Lab Isolate" /LENGTH=423 /DNA_ID=CAMNT_0023436955 /DNA_START=106 /DNA_END=1377 /DNA_ORIENTATION=+
MSSSGEEVVDPREWMRHPVVIVADWIGFLVLVSVALYLHSRLKGYGGPEANEHYFFGYREEKMLSVYVNLFAGIAYWARVCSHANGDRGPAANIETYKYLDYVITCPLLTIDLMWSLNLPHKFTSATNVAVCILCAYACDSFEAPARFMWFGFGICLFIFTWLQIIKVVRQRLDQFVSKVAKRIRNSLKIAVMTYFTVWCGYPCLWVLEEIGVLEKIPSAVMHVFLDVCAKSVYGLALLQFQLGGEKHAFIFIPLRPDEDNSKGVPKPNPPQLHPTQNEETAEDDEEEFSPKVFGSLLQGLKHKNYEAEDSGEDSSHNNGPKRASSDGKLYASAATTALTVANQLQGLSREECMQRDNLEVQKTVGQIQAISSEILKLQGASASGRYQQQDDGPASEGEVDLEEEGKLPGLGNGKGNGEHHCV